MLALLQLTGGQLSEIVLIGVQPECLDDYGGSLTPQVKAQLMPAVYLAQEVLAQWGITASSAALPTERLNHYSLCMERYEDERPDAQSACRVGDIRVLQRENHNVYRRSCAGYFTRSVVRQMPRPTWRAYRR